MTSSSEVIGFLASALVLMTFAMKDMRLLRVTAVFSNLAFLIYGGLNQLLPVVVLHFLLLPLNAYRLAGAWKPSQPAPFERAYQAADKATKMAIDALLVTNDSRRQREAKSGARQAA